MSPTERAAWAGAYNEMLSSLRWQLRKIISDSPSHDTKSLSKGLSRIDDAVALIEQYRDSQRVIAEKTGGQQ